MNRSANSRGFTIVESVIVLAIAGLLLLRVFTIIPATQRNSRNSQRRTDTSTILRAVGKYQSDHLGSFTASCTGSTCATVCSSDPGFMCGVNLRFFDISRVSAVANPGPSGPITVSGVDTIKIANYLRCDGNTPNSNNAASRDIIAVFNAESSNGTVPQCIQL